MAGEGIRIGTAPLSIPRDGKPRTVHSVAVAIEKSIVYLTPEGAEETITFLRASIDKAREQQRKEDGA